MSKSEVTTLPDFFIIGAQKCGTTWLHQMLASHPKIYMPKGKDDEFFSYLPDKDIAEYEVKFSQAQSTQLIGDSCASYFWTARKGDQQPQGFNPQIPKTMRQALGSDCRYIVLLKDPIQRTISGYLHHIAHGSLDCNTPILEAPPERGLIALSRYGHHLASWREYIDDEKLLVLPAPESHNHEQLLTQCCTFLGLEPDFNHLQAAKKVFAGLKRMNDESGVWVALGQRGLESIEKIQRPVPLKLIEGQQYVRLVHNIETQQLKLALQSDTSDFAEQLAAMSINADAFSHWDTWPQ